MAEQYAKLAALLPMFQLILHLYIYGKLFLVMDPFHLMMK